MKIKDVSVVIPYYNGSKYLERAVKSALDQTFRPKEVIVVDDGSSPSEAKFAKELSKKLGFKLFTKPNGGQGSARNFGVSKTTTDFFCLLDQDDYFLEWHIQHLVEVTESQADTRFAFTYGDSWRVTEAGLIVRQATALHYSDHPKTDLYEQLSEDMHILPSTSIIFKKAFKEVGGFDEKLTGYEDDDLFLRFFVSGFTSVFTPKAVTVWTINTESTSFSVKMSRSRWLYLEKLMNSFPDDYSAGVFIFRDHLLKRFMRSFLLDYLTSCYLRDDNYSENKARLSQFEKLIAANRACADKGALRFALRILVKFPRSLVVFCGNVLSTAPVALLLRVMRVTGLVKNLRTLRAVSRA